MMILLLLAVSEQSIKGFYKVGRQSQSISVLPVPRSKRDEAVWCYDQGTGSC